MKRDYSELIDDYEAWVRRNGHLTSRASSVLGTYIADHGLENEEDVTDFLSNYYGFNDHTVKRYAGQRLREASRRMNRREVKNIIRSVLRESYNYEYDELDPGDLEDEEWARFEAEHNLEDYERGYSDGTIGAPRERGATDAYMDGYGDGIAEFEASYEFMTESLEAEINEPVGKGEVLGSYGSWPQEVFYAYMKDVDLAKQYLNKIRRQGYRSRFYPINPKREKISSEDILNSEHLKSLISNTTK